MTTSKVKAITGTKERQGQNGLVYYISMDMENGDKVNIGKKNKDAFKIGDEINYDVVSEDAGVKKIKEVKEEFKKSFTPQNPRISAVTMAMSYSKDLVVAGKVDIKDIKESATSIFNRMLETINALDTITK